MENLNLFPRNLEVGMFYAKRFMEKVIVLDLILIRLTWKNSSKSNTTHQEQILKSL